MAAIKLRPHHLLDIVTKHGQGLEFKPHPYGHALHTMAAVISTDLDLQVELVIGADQICQPCMHLRPDGSCDDLLTRLDPPIPKQEYNDDLDRRLCTYLGFAPGTVITIRGYLSVVNEKTPGLETVCTHPGEDEKVRLAGLIRGLRKLGIRGSTDEEGEQE